MSISKFRNSTHQTLARVRRTRKPIRITKFGRPLVEIVPAPDIPKERWVGTMIGTGHIVGAIVSPAGNEEVWEVLHS
jgi:prevent-host-death family protein